MVVDSAWRIPTLLATLACIFTLGPHAATAATKDPPTSPLAALPQAPTKPRPHFIAYSRPVTRRQYQQDSQAIVDRMLADVFHDVDDWVGRQKKFESISHAALAQAHLWTWTGEQRYAAGANRFLLAVASRRDQLREADFFTVYPFAKTYEVLLRTGQLEPRTAEAAQAFILQRFRARDVGDHNQAFTRAAGLALAAKLFPDANLADRWRSYAEAVWRHWLELGDVTENASNYNRIDAAYLFLLGDLLHRTEDLRRPSVRAMYERWRDQVAPSGAIPAYGDSGSGPLEPLADWPRVNAWAQWVAGFERAGTFYDDPSFQWAARRLYDRGMHSEPLGRRYFHVIALTALMQASDWMSPQGLHEKSWSELLATRATGPLLQTRREWTTQWGSPVRNAWDKLILHSAKTEAAPFLLCDLYARGHHGHVNQHGGINWFEVNQVPLITNLGYNNREPHHTNAFVIQPNDGEPFPHRQRFRANRWQTAELPTVRLPSPPGKPHLRMLSELGLRVASRQGVTFWADNLRLAGSAKRVEAEGQPEAEGPDDPDQSNKDQRLLEGFEDPTGWNHSPHPTGMSTEGEFALVWQFPPGAHMTFRPGTNRRLRAFEFDPRQYPRLLIDWKLSDNAEQARPFILRAGADFHAHTLQLAPRLDDVRVQQNAEGDQWAALIYENWFVEGTRYCRQMALLKEGVFIVSDTIWPTPGARGRLAGPVWHVGTRELPERAAAAGPAWFVVSGSSQPALVHLGRQRTSRRFGVQSADVWSILGQKTIFAVEPLGADPIAFVTSFVPLTAGEVDSKDAATALATSIHVHSEVSGDAAISRVEFTRPSARVHVTVALNSTGFQVTRQAAR